MSPSPKFSFGNCCGFVLSRLAIGSQNRTASGENFTLQQKKRILLFGRMRAKSLVDIFRQMG